MAWPRDEAKLDRVRMLMSEHELDAVVVRAPDNVLYLKPGDEVECEIENVGVLRNRIVAWADVHANA